MTFNYSVEKRNKLWFAKIYWGVHQELTGDGATEAEAIEDLRKRIERLTKSLEQWAMDHG